MLNTIKMFFNTLMLCFFCYILTIVGAGTAFSEGLGTEQITKGDYTIEITHLKTETVTDENPIPGSDVKCGEFPTDVTFTMKEEFTSTITDELIKELSASLGLGIGVDIEAIDLDAKIKFRTALLNSTRRFQGESISTKATKNINVEELRCFDQKTFLKKEKKTYLVKTEKEEGLFFTEIVSDEFQWEETTRQWPVLIATYNESCDLSRCKIPGANIRVKGKGEKPLEAHIPFKSQTTYVLPLYYNQEWELINLIDLLPDEVKEYLRR